MQILQLLLPIRFKRIENNFIQQGASVHGYSVRVQAASTSCDPFSLTCNKF